MIIVSQDKDVIVNFDRTQNIWIDVDVLDKTNTSFDIVADEQTIGTYATEERAKEILKEMVRKYELGTNKIKIKNSRGAEIVERNIIYEMPKELIR